VKYREEDKIGTFSRRYTQKGDKNEEKRWQISKLHTVTLHLQQFNYLVLT
jgi:hypothetical protein